MSEQQCDEHIVIDFDSIHCDRPAGHQGFHSMQGDGPRFKWVQEHTGSTGYVSPKETWPDDTEADAAIAEAETAAEGFWEIGEKYEIPATGNYPRWQEGVFLRSMGDFIEDCLAVSKRFEKP